MEPVAQVTQLPDGRIMTRMPQGADLVWLLGWLETIKQSVHNQMAAQAQRTIAVPPPEAVGGILLNGAK